MIFHLTTLCLGDMRKTKQKDAIDSMVKQLGKSRRHIEDHLYLVNYPDFRGKTKKQIQDEFYSPLPDSRSGMPYHIQKALNIVSSFCPVCGDQARDRRFKGIKSGPSVFTRKFTKTGVTRECRCGIRFYFTWRTFVNVLKKRLAIEERAEMKLWYRIWITITEAYFGLNSSDRLAKIEALRQRSRKTR